MLHQGIALPDGRRADLAIEAAVVDPAEIDALEVIKAQWAEIGIAVLVRGQPRQVVCQRIALPAPR